jgi:hypothetical protein
MILTEIFNEVYPFKFKKFDDGKAATFKNANGDKVTVSFIGYHIPENGWSYEMSFAIDNSIELTGKGDEFKTLSTVIAIVHQFIKDAKFQPTVMFCTANTDERRVLYTKIMRKSIGAYNYKMVTPTDLKPAVAEWARHIDHDDEHMIMIAKPWVLK